jgi:hypothetical protein
MTSAKLRSEGRTGHPGLPYCPERVLLSIRLQLATDSRGSTGMPRASRGRLSFRNHTIKHASCVITRRVPSFPATQARASMFWGTRWRFQ